MEVWQCLTFRQWLIRNVRVLRNASEDYISPWKQILSFFLNDYGGKFPASCIAISVLLTCVAVLLISIENVLKSGAIYRTLSVKPILSCEQALNQVLWNKQFLRIGGKPIFNKTLFSKSLISLAYILTNTGSLKVLLRSNFGIPVFSVRSVVNLL